MSCSKIYYNSLVTWHFLSTMQIGLKSMNSLSGAEHKMRNGGMLAGKKAGQQDQPWNATPPPMGWYFIHPRGLKKDTVLSPQAANSQERCSLTSQPIQPSEAGVQRLNPLAPSEVGGNQTKAQALGLGPPTLTLLFVFSFCLSSKCWSPQLSQSFSSLPTSTLWVHWAALYILWYTVDFLCSFLMHSPTSAVCLIRYELMKTLATEKKPKTGDKSILHPS